MSFTIAPVKRMLKGHGIRRVSAEAARFMAIVLEEKLAELAQESEKIARHSGRKTILRRDVKLAKKVAGL